MTAYLKFIKTLFYFSNLNITFKEKMIQSNTVLKFIEELKLSKPNYILLHGPQDFYGGISVSERLPYVYKYILDNYSKHKQVYEWIFYKKNKS